MAKIEHFEELVIWQNALDIAVSIFKISNDHLLKKEYGIRDQIIKSSLSISSNIAEGFEYNNNKEFSKYLKYAKGSGGELRSQLYFLKATELIKESDFNFLHEKVKINSSQIKSFITYLKQYEARNLQTFKP